MLIAGITLLVLALAWLGITSIVYAKRQHGFFELLDAVLFWGYGLVPSTVVGVLGIVFLAIGLVLRFA